MQNFYSHLQSFLNLRDLMVDANYVEVPDDWHIAIADVTSSTRAIEAGQYKEVNFVGAACIVALANALKGDEIPYAFGGDGATFLLPPHRLADAREALRAVAAVAKTGYQLTLRIGIVPLSEVIVADLGVKVAKYQISKGNYLAMFKGGGIAYAERLIKRDERYLIVDPPEEEKADFTGLSCRWQPYQSQNGKILSLIIMATDQKAIETYDEVIAFIYPRAEVRERSPVSEKNFAYQWSASGIQAEVRLNNKGHDSRWLYWLISIKAAVVKAVLKYGISTYWFDPERYKREMLSHSDFLRFDDCLRMVIDCSEGQIDQIIEFLNKLKADKRLVFGTHLSASALMTCVVRKARTGNHVHFIDGADGGYALAAKMLKMQLHANLQMDAKAKDYEDFGEQARNAEGSRRADA